MKIEYTKVGDYYLPNLYYPEETRPIGLWGMLRKEYLKEHKIWNLYISSSDRQAGQLFGRSE